MTPSARKRATLLPSSSTAKSPMRAMSPLETTTSFRLQTATQRALAPEFGVEHGARIHLMAAAVPAIERRIEVGQANFSQEAKRSEVHAEDGCASRAKIRATERSVPSPPARSPVPAPARHCRAVNGWSLRSVLSALAVEQRLIAVLAQPGNQLRQQPGQLFLPRFADNRYANHADSSVTDWAEFSIQAPPHCAA